MRMPPFGGMPMMMMMPGGMPGMEMSSSQPTTPDNPIPARVKVAMELMGMLHAKQMNRGAVADGAMQALEIDGIPLNINEEGAQEAACEMLSAYFRGSLKMDAWEQLRHDAVSQRIEHEFKKDTQGNIATCPSCAGGVGLPCSICKGTGKVIMTAPLESGVIVSPNGPPEEPSDPMSEMMNRMGQGPPGPPPPEDSPGPETEDPTRPKDGPEDHDRA